MPIEDPQKLKYDIEKVKKNVKKFEPDFQPKEAGYSTGGPVEAGKDPKKATDKAKPFQGEQY